MNIAIIGAGLTGAVIAERYARNGQNVNSVVVFEKRDHIGGNCYDYVDEETGILVSKYGPHFFHTNDEDVWQYIQQFATWIPYEARIKSRVVTGSHGQEKIVDVPVNINTVNTLFGLDIKTSEEMDAWLTSVQVPIPGQGMNSAKNSEEVCLARVGMDLYNLMFKGYTLKQWETDPKDLGPSVLARIPVRNNHDDRYFTDKYQAIPSKGYTDLIANMLRHPKITVNLNCDFLQFTDAERLALGFDFDHVFFTGPIDAYFADSGLPKLQYRSLTFKHERPGGIGQRFYQDHVTINEPSIEVPYTRTTEYAHLPYEQTKASSNENEKRQHKKLIIREYSTQHGDPYYPVPNEKNQALYLMYKRLADIETEKHNVHFVGRLASYKYYNMDQAIKAALDTFLAVNA